MGGRGHWLHAAATADPCAYVIDAGRGKRATDRLIGENFSAQLVHDGWAPYDRYLDASHQQRVTHLLRRCGEMIRAATPGAAAFPSAVKAMLQRALELRDERDAGRRSLRSTRNRATRLTEAIRRLCRCVKRNAANERRAGFLYRHAGQLFTFLRHPGLDATNWRGEHAMRYPVVNRKVWGGNRTHRGGDNQAILMGVLRTLKLREIQPIEWLRKKRVHLNPPILC